MRFFGFLVFIFLCCFTPSVVLAHSADQPPFFTLNGKYTKVYLVPRKSVMDLTLPEDIAPENYLVNQSIQFEIDTKEVSFPQDPNFKLEWDYGDGAKAEGIKNSHTYTKPGSYILAVNMKNNTSDRTVLFESVMIHVLPDTSYQLPKATIKVNNQEAKGGFANPVSIDLNNPATLDAGSSTAPSSKIDSYLWDFGDEKSSTQAKIDHRYENAYQMLLILRVKDANGFIADNMVLLDNINKPTDPPTPASSPTTNTTGSNNKTPYVFLAVSIIVFLFGLSRLRFKNRKKP